MPLPSFTPDIPSSFGLSPSPTCDEPCAASASAAAAAAADGLPGSPQSTSPGILKHKRYPFSWDRTLPLLEHLTYGDPACKARRLSDEDVRHLGALLEGEHCRELPPDRDALLQAWIQRLRAPLSQALHQPETFPGLVLGTDELRSLRPLLLDILCTTCVRDPHGGWSSMGQRALVMVGAVGHWMRSGSPHDAAQRSDIGRQLLRQIAGLSRDLELSDAAGGLDLPDPKLLGLALMPGARAHLTVHGGPQTIANAMPSLSALPLRTWRLARLDTLQAMHEQPQLSLRLLDLTLSRDRWGAQELRRLREVAATQPNLWQVNLPRHAPPDALGFDWERRQGRSGSEWLRVGRPDGLSALDAAAAAWKSRHIRSDMPLRHMASDPDACHLLRLATQLATTAPEGMAQCLARLLERCAAGPDELHRHANEARQLWQAGLSPEAFVRSLAPMPE